MTRPLRDKAYQICREFLSGSWKSISSKEMVFKSVSGGLSNVLFYCSLPSTHTPLRGEPSQVILRMYGQLHSEKDQGEGNQPLSTITESVIFMLLSERKLGPKLYGIFPGGRLEEYLPARAMTCAELRDPFFSTIIARKLARVHQLDVPINKEPTWLFEKYDEWLKVARSHDPADIEPEKQDLAAQLLGFDFESEIKWLQSFLVQVKSPVVFSHNDLQEGNVLLPDVDKQTNRKLFHNQSNQNIDERVVFIDFEYCSYNYRGFDLGNHFCEWAFDYSNPEYPHFYANLANFPKESDQRLFVREYLRNNNNGKVTQSGLDPNCDRTKKTNKGKSISIPNQGPEGTEFSEETENELLNEANAFVLGSHMLWILWSINNAFSSKIQFGYWEYGKARLDAYFTQKRRFLKNQQLKNRNL